MDGQAIARLQEKTASKAIVEQLQRDFNLAPLVAKTLRARCGLFREHHGKRTKAGQMTYVAVGAGEPAGRKLEEVSGLR